MEHPLGRNLAIDQYLELFFFVIKRGPVSRPGTSGTLRSMQSMPLLSPLHAPYNPTLVPGGVYGLGLVATTLSRALMVNMAAGADV